MRLSVVYTIKLFETDAMSG